MPNDHESHQRRRGARPLADLAAHERPRHASEAVPASRRNAAAAHPSGSPTRSPVQPRPAGAPGSVGAARGRRSVLSPLAALRTWLPAVIVLAGVLLVAVRPDETGLDGASMLVGAGLAVWLFNFFFRMGVSGDRDRAAEEDARRYLDTHGHWPDEQ